jgi:periplasmic copper chaperone A
MNLDSSEVRRAAGEPVGSLAVVVDDEITGADAPTLAQEFKAGDIIVDKAWARATPKGAEVGAGYFVVHNNGASPDTLTGGSADFATVEIHEMKTEDGVMRMGELKNGLDIPAHATIRLAPGGYHIMFTHLTKPLTKGEKVKATLTFESAGPVAIELPVEEVGASGPMPMKGGAMGGMKM